MKNLILQSLYAVLLLTVLVLSIIGTLVYQNISSMTERSHLLTHTQQVLFKTEQTLSILTAAEAGQRGFLVVRDSSFLENYFDSIDSIDPCLDHMRLLVKDNPLQVRRVDTLWQLANKRYQILNSVLVSSIPYYRSDVSGEQMRNGKKVMDKVRRLVERMKTTEQELYLKRTKDFGVVSSKTLKWLAVLFVVSVGLFAGAFYFILRELRKRWHYQGELGKAAVQLSASNAELDSFAYISSHHLQEPLRKLQTFSDRLCSKYLPELTGDAHFLVQRMGDTANQMQALIQDLLTFNQLGKVRQDRNFQRVSLTEMLEDLIKKDFLEQIARQQAVVRTIGTVPLIQGLDEQLRTLFGHLLHNSLKFARPNQPLVVEVAFEMVTMGDVAVWPDSTSDERWVRVVFSDNGIGFDPNYKDKVFELFQRLHRNSEYAGTGLGLAICKKVVFNHQGHITVDSQPDEGTKFVIYLPVQQHRAQWRPQR